LFSALGGKWTTSRQLAETVVQHAAAALERKLPPSRSATIPLPGGAFDDFSSLARGFEKAWPGIAAIRHLAHMHGARLPLVLKGARLTDLAPLGPSLDTMAQVEFAMREEMALTLEDMVMRRTSLGQFGLPAALGEVAARMGEYQSWDAARRQNEIDAVLRLYRVQT
jgi:glycerol-3-phosphate dehydrogenase